LQYISKETDAGDIVDQVRIKIAKGETATTLNQKMLKLHPQIIIKNLDDIFSKKNKQISQKHNLATFTCKRTPEDGRIDFKKTTKEILNLIRGLSYPYPGAYCFYKKQRIIIWEADEVRKFPKYVGRITGRIINIQNNSIDALTGDGILRIKKIALENDPDNFLVPKQIINSISYSLN
jgi:methionyl-tRNA formyltransferase